MTLDTLITRIGARWIVAGNASHIAICGAYAGDRVSDLLNHVSEDTLLITHLSNSSLIRLIELMDARAICLAGGVEPDDGLVAVAREQNASLAVSPSGMYETCGKIYAALSESQHGGAP